MKAQPTVARKVKQHLFAVRLRAEQTRSPQVASQGVRVRSTKDAFGGVQGNPRDGLSLAHAPTAPIKLDFSKLRHGKSRKKSSAQSEEVSRRCSRLKRADTAGPQSRKAGLLQRPQSGRAPIPSNAWAFPGRPLSSNTES